MPGTGRDGYSEAIAKHKKTTGARSIRAGRRLVLLLVGWVVVEYLVLPQWAATRNAIHLLARFNPLWLVAGISLQAGSLLCYSQLTRSLARRRLSRPTAARVTVATLGVSHVIPGGTVAGTSLGYRLLRHAGLSGADAGFVLATQSIGSAVVLNLLL